MQHPVALRLVELGARDNHLATIREQAHRYVFLDGLRGVAAIAVMYAHLSLLTRGSNPLPNAAYAVDFFFVLSGFVLAFAYADKLQNGSLTLWPFMVIRFIRLYPMLILGIAIASTLAVAQLAVGRGSMSQLAVGLVTSTSGVPVIDGTPHKLAFPLIGPQWSLTYEIAINALLAVAVPFLSKRWILIATIVFAVLYLAIAIMGHAFAGPGTNDFFWGIPRVLFGFTAGVALWMIAPRRLHLGRVAAALVCGLLAAFLCGPSFGWFNIAAVLGLFPAVIWFGSRVELGGRAGTIASALGDLSYPLYILHWPLVGVFREVNTHLPASVGTVAYLIEGAAIIAATYFAATKIDLPFRRMLRRRLAARKPVLLVST